MEYKIEYDYKTLLFGDSGVGKSTLRHRSEHGGFREDLKRTIGVVVGEKNFYIDQVLTKFLIYDLSGERAFRYLLGMYLRGASCGIFVYDTTRRETFDHLLEWIQGIRVHCQKIPIVVVGSKADLPKGDNSVELPYARRKAGELGIHDVMEVSSKTGWNVQRVFKVMAMRTINTSKCSIRVVY